MRIVPTALVVFALWLLGTLVVPSAPADEQDKKTAIPFSQRCEIRGGKVLPARTYTFSLFDSPSDPHNVQILNANGTHLFATIWRSIISASRRLARP
jgi:hypothetical protein